MNIVYRRRKSEKVREGEGRTMERRGKEGGRHTHPVV